jgi:putative tricarboxylic transport membrane protein
MDIILQAAADAFSLYSLAAILFGVFTGIVVGATPGLNKPMAIAVAVPLTLTMDPLAALGMLVGVMKGAGFGGAISATLLNAPGEPSAAVTALDAHPLAKEQGKPRKALKMALYASVSGDTCSDIVLITLAAPLAGVASQMGRVEQAAIILFSFTMVAGLSGRSLTRGIIATLIGILIAQVGRIENGLAERFTFGLLELSDGIPIASLAIGVLALPEVLIQIQKGRVVGPADAVIEETGPPENQMLTFREFWNSRKAIATGATIGTIMGALPGLGASVAAFLSYGLAKRFSKNPEKFGNGALDGISAAESANSSVNGANLIPLLTLGIPGNVAAALMVGAFVIHGIAPGPQVFVDDTLLIYGLFVSMMIANVSTFLMGRVGLGFFTMILSTPGQIIFPIVALLCVTGVYLTSGIGLVGVALMIGFAALGYLMRSFDYSIVNFVLGFVLGDLFEKNLRSAVTILHRDPINGMFEHLFAFILMFGTVVFVIGLLIKRRRSRA